MTDAVVPLKPSVPDQEYVYEPEPPETAELQVAEPSINIVVGLTEQDTTKGGGALTVRLLEQDTTLFCPSAEFTIREAILVPEVK
ncbi:MAG: hypothetical protein UW70_C0071G0002 [Candidatus Peregrinibacteria bacterium GW2011_GWA2_44_7]|nr:MAG: hypothetical protein UW70_C0071G0002 [Candidatus Peregrinibacteria bacterium GW2011_GWA2_44_7]